MKQIRNYTLQRILGEGTYGQVWYASSTTCTQDYAIKVVPLKNLKDVRDRYMKSEIQILQKLNSKYVVKFVETFSSTNNLYLVTEFCPGGDLDDCITKRGPLDDRQAKRLLAQLVIALQDLKSQNVIHRDIKPANVLLTDSNIERTDVKLADFGFAKCMEEDLTSSYLGTLLYMAPEILKNGPYDYRADVWSLGVLAYKMFIGSLPFEFQNETELINRQVNFILPPFANISHEVKDLILGMLTFDSKLRITLDQIKDHPAISPYIQQINLQNTSTLYKSQSHTHLKLSNLLNDPEAIAKEYNNILNAFLNAKEKLIQSMEESARDNLTEALSLLTISLELLEHCQVISKDRFGYPNRNQYIDLASQIFYQIQIGKKLLNDILTYYNSTPSVPNSTQVYSYHP